jgi:tetratricopeptide (TPR) repeat protein
MDQRLVELSRTVDPVVLGQRLRLARLASGLTQGELADGVASTAYISRIEAGHRRPDLGVLDRLADRLGTTAEALLIGLRRDKRAEIQVDLDHAEVCLVSGNAAEALVGVEKALGELPQEDTSGLRRDALFLHAFALEASGKLDDAIAILEELTDTSPADLTWLRGQIALSRCYREAGDLAMSIEVGEKAGATLEEQGLAGLSEAVQLTLTVAASYFERGDTTYAVRMCSKAIREAEGLASTTARGSAYWNASIMASRRGSVDEGVALARKALHIFEQDADGRNLARLRTDLGILQLRLDPPEATAAKSNLERSARELDWTSSSPMDKAENQLALARANLLLGDITKAELQATAGYYLSREHAPLAAADALVLQGQVAACRGRSEDATNAYREAILVLSGVGADRRAAELWFELGDLLQQAGDAEAASDAYRRAAASTGLTPRTSLRDAMARVNMHADTAPAPVD